MPEKKTASGGRPRLTPKPSTDFAKWLKSTPMTVSEVAEELDVSVSSIHGLKEGRFPPGLKLALRIERLTEGEILASSWVD